MNLYNHGCNARSCFIILLLTCFVSTINGQSLHPFIIRGHFTTPPPADTVYLYISDKEYKAPIKNRSNFVINGQVPRTLLGYISLRKGNRDELFFVDSGTTVATFTGSMYEIKSSQQSIPVFSVMKFERSISQAFIDTVRSTTVGWSYPYRPYDFNKKVYHLLDSLTRRYPDNDAIVFLQSGFTGFLTSAQIKKLRSLLSKEAQQCMYNKSIEEGLAQSQELEIFEPIYVNQQQQLNQLVKRSYASFGSGKPGYVFIDFWATWCKPCLEEIDVVKATLPGNANMQVVSISFDKDSTTWQKTINSRQIPGIHYLEANGFYSTLARDLSINYIPYNLLVDPSGIVIARSLRGSILANILRTIREQGTAAQSAIR